jgi:hypothetical protein
MTVRVDFSACPLRQYVRTCGFWYANFCGAVTNVMHIAFLAVVDAYSILFSISNSIDS